MKNRVLAILLCITMIITMSAGCGKRRRSRGGGGGGGGGSDSWENLVSVECVEGTEGAKDSEGFENLFDQKSRTKWCVANFEQAYAVWTMSEEITVTGYRMVTANDNSKYEGRNPSTWTLYGANGDEVPQIDSDDWAIVHEVYNDDVLEDIDLTEYYYEVEDNDEAYNHYMLVIEEIKGENVMQLAEFALDYDGAVYELDKVETEDGGNNGSNGSQEYGNRSSTYILNDVEYVIAVGDTLVLYNAYIPVTDFYAYNWEVSGDEGCVELDPMDATCGITALEEGKVTITAIMTCTSYGSGTYSYETIATVRVVERGSSEAKDYGSMSDGACPRCHGFKIIDCSACYGDGELPGGAPCTGCDDGKVTCDQCHGSGNWTN